MRLYWKDFLVKLLSQEKYPSALLGRQIGKLPESENRRNTLFVAAHADDETIGAGVAMQRCLQSGENVLVVIASNGAKSSPTVDVASLVNMRISEMFVALGVLGLDEGSVVFLGLPDGLVYRYWTELEKDISRIIKQYRPSTIYTHSIEGGHLDHDVVSYVVQASAKALGVDSIREWAEYSPLFPMRQTGLDFADNWGEAPRCVLPSHGELQVRRQMLRAFESQGVAPLYEDKPEMVREGDTSRQLERLRLYYYQKHFWRQRLAPMVRHMERRNQRS